MIWLANDLSPVPVLDDNTVEQSNIVVILDRFLGGLNRRIAEEPEFDVEPSCGPSIRHDAVRSIASFA